jgi:cytochrome c oxidase subunit IV
MSQSTNSPSLTTYAIVYVALLVLLAATIVAAHFPLGAWNVPVALGIAFTKTMLVALFFMHVRYSGRLIWVVAGGALVWLAILLSVYHDYYTRGWTPNRLSADPTDVSIELLEDSRRVR